MRRIECDPNPEARAGDPCDDGFDEDLEPDDGGDEPAQSPDGDDAEEAG